MKRPDPRSLLHICSWLGILLIFAGCANVNMAPREDALGVDAPQAPPRLAAEAAPEPERDDPLSEPLPQPKEDIQYGHFPEEILTRVILAEMAGQRGHNREAMNEYLRLARETEDLNIIKRASRVATFVQDVAAARELADMWLAQEPDSVEAHRTLAFQMLALSRYGQAIDYLVRLLEMGQNVDFRVVTSRTSRDPNANLFLDTLIGDFTDLLDRYPENQSLRLALAHLYEQDDQPRKAYEHVSALAREMNDAPDVVLLEVQLLEMLDQDEQALSRLSESLQTHPEHKELRYQYARRLIDKGEYRTAREQLNTLVERHPKEYDMMYSLALINLELDDNGPAKELLQRLVSAGERLNEAHYYLGLINEDEDNPEQAVGHYRQVDGGGNHMQALRNMTEILVDRGRYAEARNHLQQARYDNPDFNIPLLSMEAAILVDAERYQEAERLLDNAVDAFPDNMQLLYQRAVLNQERNNLDAMERDLRRIIELNPDSPVAYNTLGYVLADRTSRYEEAYELIKKAIELAPDDPAIIDSLGWVQYRLGMYEAALENLDRAFELYPDHEVAAHLGEVLWVMGKKNEARRVWSEALQEMPDSRYIKDAMERLTE